MTEGEVILALHKEVIEEQRRCRVAMAEASGYRELVLKWMLSDAVTLEERTYLMRHESFPMSPDEAMELIPNLYKENDDPCRELGL